MEDSVTIHKRVSCKVLQIDVTTKLSVIAEVSILSKNNFKYLTTTFESLYKVLFYIDWSTHLEFSAYFFFSFLKSMKNEVRVGLHEKFRTLLFQISRMMGFTAA